MLSYFTFKRRQTFYSTRLNKTQLIEAVYENKEKREKTEEIQKAIYTTNAIESLNNSLRKVTKTRNSFPNDEAAIKLLYMGLKNIMKKLTMPVWNWNLAIHQFSIRFGERMLL